MVDIQNQGLSNKDYLNIPRAKDKKLSNKKAKTNIKSDNKKTIIDRK